MSRERNPNTIIELVVMDELIKKHQLLEWTFEFYKNAPSTTRVPCGTLQAVLLLKHKEKYGADFAEEGRGVVSRYITTFIEEGVLRVPPEEEDE